MTFCGLEPRRGFVWRKSKTESYPVVSCIQKWVGIDNRLVYSISFALLVMKCYGEDEDVLTFSLDSVTLNMHGST